MNNKVGRAILICGQEKFVTIIWRGAGEKCLSICVCKAFMVEVSGVMSDINCGFLYRCTFAAILTRWGGGVRRICTLAYTALSCCIPSACSRKQTSHHQRHLTESI